MKIRIQYLIILIPTVAVSCGTLRYNKVYSYEDEFRGNSKAYTRIRVRPEERRTEIGWARIVLERQSAESLANAYFVIFRSASSFGAGNTAYLKAGDKKFELFIKDPESKIRTRSEATISGILSVDSSGVVSGQTADIDTRTWIEEKFMIDFLPEMSAAIVGSLETDFRFYFGPIPVTYEIKGKKLAALRKLLAL